MAWLELTHLDGRKAILNTDQISEISERGDSPQTAIWSGGRLMFFRESLEEIGDMIERGEARKRIERIFLAIVCNFRHGYNPEEIWEAASVLHHANKPEYREAIIDG